MIPLVDEYLEDNYNDDLTMYMYYVVNDITDCCIFQTRNKERAFEMANSLQITGLNSYSVYQKPMMYYEPYIDMGEDDYDDE